MNQQIAMKTSFVVSGLALVLVLSGCVTHMPMSDTVMFRDARRTSPVHETSFGIGAAVSQTISPTDYVHDGARRQWFVEGASSLSFPSNNLGLQGTALYLGLYDRGNFGLSGSFGPGTFGGDVTVKLYGPNYFTAGFSFFGGSQLMLQHRAFNSSLLGAAVGVYYRWDYASFRGGTRGDDSMPAHYYRSGERWYTIESVGVSTTVVARARSQDPGPLKVTLFTGYAPEYNHMVVSFGAALGVF